MASVVLFVGVSRRVDHVAPDQLASLALAERRTIQSHSDEGGFSVYAIVRAGGRQEKVAVGDVLTVDRVVSDAGSTIELTPVLLVDGEKITSDADALAKVKVSAEIVDQTKGPKITILRYKNKSGYRRRQGHRAKLTRIKVTDISA